MNLCIFSGRIASPIALKSDKLGNLYCDIRLAIPRVPRGYKSNQPKRKAEQIRTDNGEIRYRVVEINNTVNLDKALEAATTEDERLRIIHDHCSTEKSTSMQTLFMTVRAYHNKAYTLAMYGRVGRYLSVRCQYDHYVFVGKDNRKHSCHQFKLLSFEFGDKRKDIFPDDKLQKSI